MAGEPVRNVLGGRKRGLARAGLGLGLALALALATASAPPASGQASPQAAAGEDNLLKLLGIRASEESLDYVMNKTQFQLHTLLTEQRHPKTMNLSEKVQADASAGLDLLFSVDEDVAAKLEALASDPRALEELSEQAGAAIVSGRKIYVYGCGATGRLAKQMESAFWRPFWRKVKAQAGIWSKLKGRLGEDIEERLIGEMTGGDRALISSLEGFEDLQLIGRLQLQDRGIGRGDLIVAVTEGGETSSVIGTVLGGLDQWKSAPGFKPEESRRRLYFVYNNPDDRLLPFERSRKVIEDPGITKINLTTGPQAITGSTRMQATTIETFVLGQVFEDALGRVLRPLLSRKEMARLGFSAERRTIARRLGDFRKVLASVRQAIPALARVTELESATYAGNHFATYFARDGLITVFIDSTERSPTFRLFPLDTTAEPRRRCWIQVWTPAPNLRGAWQAFLGRPFRGLSPALYGKPFEESIEDPYLRAAALESLKKAGNDQQDLYDFSFSDENIRKRGPQKDDLGLAVALDEDEDALAGPDSPYKRFFDLFQAKGGRTVLISVGRNEGKAPSKAYGSFLASISRSAVPPLAVRVEVPGEDDIFALNSNIALKIMLNAHSTAVMARLGRVVGNAMTSVSPSNLKLIGRATYLIQSQVNDVLARPAWVQRHGLRRPVTYGEANAVLFDSIAFVKSRPREAGQTAEVGLSIIRILQSLRDKQTVSPEVALGVFRSKGLGRFLAGLNQP